VEIVHNASENYSIINSYEKEYSDFTLHFFNEDGETETEEGGKSTERSEEEEEDEEKIEEGDAEGSVGDPESEKDSEVSDDDELAETEEDLVSHNTSAHKPEEIMSNLSVASSGVSEDGNQESMFTDDSETAVEGNTSYVPPENQQTFEPQSYHMSEIEMLAKVGELVQG
jgi:uncharacterized protein YydD (DUF2326 family)